MSGGVTAGVDIDGYIRWIKNRVEHCIRGYMNEEETVERLWRACKIPHRITSALWRILEENNPEFFRDYSLRLVLLRQIKTFNMLLNLQAQFMTIRNWQAPPCQNFPSFNNGQLTKFSDMRMIPNAAVALPQYTSPSYPSCWPANGISHPGNNMDAPANYMISAPDFNLAYGYSSGSFMHQKYPPHFSSTFPGNGSILQLPMMHDSSLLPSSRNQNQIGGNYSSLLHARTSSNTDVHSPMNTEDENGTVTQLAFGGLSMDNCPSV